LNFVDENDEVLLAGFGRKGRPRVIFLVCDSRLSRFLVLVSAHSGRRRRRSHVHRRSIHGQRLAGIIRRLKSGIIMKTMVYF